MEREWIFKHNHRDKYEEAQATHVKRVQGSREVERSFNVDERLNV